MNEQAANFYIDGTAALDMSPHASHHTACRIVVFPQKGDACTASRSLHAPQHDHCGLASILDTLAGKLRHIAEASEMYCSLRFEDARGVAYNAFTRRGIGMLAGASFLVAAIALVFGA